MHQPPPPSAFRRALGVALRAGLAAAVGTAIFDLLISVAHAGDPIGIASLGRALVAALGLYGAAGTLFALGCGALAGSIVTTLPVRATLRAELSRVRADDRRDRALTAALLAGALAALLLGIIVLGFDRAIALEMSAKRNAALSTAMVAVAALPLCGLLWFPLYRMCRPLVGVLPRPRVISLLCALFGLTLLALAAALLSVEWRVLDFGPAEAFAIFCALGVGHAWFWHAGPGLTLTHRLPPAAGRLATAGVATLLTLCLLATWTGFGGDGRAVQLINEQTMGAKVLFHVARRLADRDHDGYAGRLGGGDCNDHDPRIHPGADDIPGNGIDEDCDGIDAPLAAALPKPPVTPVSAAATHYKWKGNLLVITIDTLRADRINPRIAPHLAALAHDSVWFTHAYSQAPNTPRSFPSFLTSRFPSELRWARPMSNFSPILPGPNSTTFFAALRSAGYHTVGEFSHFYLKPIYGINGGFDEWDNTGALSLHDSNTDIASPRIVPRVIAKLTALKGSSQPFVLWTHLFEPHSRYMEHPEFPVHDHGVKGLEEKYNGEVSFVDEYVGKLLDALEASGLDKTTAVVVFADHGEGFGEHRFGGERMYFHGQTLYNELLRVPLIFHVPGLSPRTIDTPVMLLDLGPTLCDLVKAPRPSSFHGRSLLGALLGEPLAPHPVYAEMLPEKAWNHTWRVFIEAGHKLIEKISEGSVELYDLKRDPTEQHDLAGSDPAELGRLKRDLAAFPVERTR